MTSDARLMWGLSLVLVPTIVFGGTTLLNVVSGRAYGTPGPPGLAPGQVAYYRAGHAHAGVLLILNLLLQTALDEVTGGLVWPTRIAAFAAPLLVSAGFFGVAHRPALRLFLYAGALCLAWSTLATGVGLLRTLGR
jgi:hypothetical protein